jgi:hypothetical protein
MENLAKVMTGPTVQACAPTCTASVRCISRHRHSLHQASQNSSHLSLDLKRLIPLGDRTPSTLLENLQHLLVRQPHKRKLLPIRSLEQIRPLVTPALLLLSCTANQVLAGIASLRPEPVPGARVSAIGQALEGQVEIGFDGLGVAAVAAFVAAVFEVPVAGDGVEADGGEAAGGDAAALLGEGMSVRVLAIEERDRDGLRWGSSRCRLLLRRCLDKHCSIPRGGCRWRRLQPRGWR